jgi:protein-S-isoprenylcysteine O-methyltransferase Ste14
MRPEENEMKDTEKKLHLFDNPRNVSWLLRVFYVICILLFVLDFILHRHVSHSWEGLTGFYAIFGFIACVTLVLVAKQMRRILRRKEDYYDVDD